MASQKSRSSDPTQPTEDHEEPQKPRPDSDNSTISLNNGQKPDQGLQAELNPRLCALQSKKAQAQATLAELEAQRSALVSQTTLPTGSTPADSLSEEERTKVALANANATIKQHINLLTKYNEIKDIAQGLMGLIAEQRGVRVGVIMEEFGMGEKD